MIIQYYYPFLDFSNLPRNIDNIDSIHELLKKYIKQFNFNEEERIIQMLDRDDYYTFLYMLYKSSASLEKALDLTMMNFIIFMFDDMYLDKIDEESYIGNDYNKTKILLDRLINILKHNEITFKPTSCEINLYDVWKRISLGISKQSCDKFIEGIINGFYAWLNETKNKKDNKNITIEEYSKLRYNSIFLPAYFYLTEYSLNIYIKDEDWKNPYLIEYNNLLSEYSALINDLASYPKEYKENNKSNMVHILSICKKIPINESIDELCKMILERKNKSLKILNLIKDNNLILYMKGIQDFAAGNSQWCMLSHRYLIDGVIIENNLVTLNIEKLKK
jgi:hypothetical protein